MTLPIAPSHTYGFNHCHAIAAQRGLQFTSDWEKNSDGKAQKPVAVFKNAAGEEVARMPMYCWRAGEGLSCVDLGDVHRLVIDKFSPV
jgi:hypothetical protein